MKNADSFALDSQPHRLAILAVAQVATEEMLAAQLRMRTVEQIKDNIIHSACWPNFIAAARAGAVQEDWLPGALGRVVLGWARTLNADISQAGAGDSN